VYAAASSPLIFDRSRRNGCIKTGSTSVLMSAEIGQVLLVGGRFLALITRPFLFEFSDCHETTNGIGQNMAGSRDNWQVRRVCEVYNPENIFFTWTAFVHVPSLKWTHDEYKSNATVTESEATPRHGAAKTTAAAAGAMVVRANAPGGRYGPGMEAGEGTRLKARV
jgi:hypothetical protein